MKHRTTRTITAATTLALAALAASAIPASAADTTWHNAVAEPGSWCQPGDLEVTLDGDSALPDGSTFSVTPAFADEITVEGDVLTLDGFDPDAHTTQTFVQATTDDGEHTIFARLGVFCPEDLTADLDGGQAEIDLTTLYIGAAYRPVEWRVDVPDGVEVTALMADGTEAPTWALPDGQIGYWGAATTLIVSDVEVGDEITVLRNDSFMVPTTTPATITLD